MWYSRTGTTQGTTEEDDVAFPLVVVRDCINEEWYFVSILLNELYSVMSYQMEPVLRGLTMSDGGQAGIVCVFDAFYRRSKLKNVPLGAGIFEACSIIYLRK